jgi:hypothetical protein
MKTAIFTSLAIFATTLLAAPLPAPQAWSVNGPLGGISYDNRPPPSSSWGPPPRGNQGRPGEFTASGPLGSATLGSDGSFSLSPGRPGQGTGISYTPGGRGWIVDGEAKPEAEAGEEVVNATEAEAEAEE